MNPIQVLVKKLPIISVLIFLESHLFMHKNLLHLYVHKMFENKYDL